MAVHSAVKKGERKNIVFANIRVDFSGKLACELNHWAERTVFQAKVSACTKVPRQ